MKTYTIRVINDENNETLTMIEFTRMRFSARDFKMITEELFIFACQGIEFKHIYADVFEGTIDELDAIYADTNLYNKHHLFTVNSNTRTNGSNITTSIIVNGECIRRMVVAQ